MQNYAVSTFIRPVKRTQSSSHYASVARTEMPAELDQAISMDCYLRPLFEQLSDVQKECYIDWVSSEPTAEGRVVRANLVCTVVRSLADVVVGIDLI